MHWDLESIWLDKRNTRHTHTHIRYTYLYLCIRIYTRPRCIFYNLFQLQLGMDTRLLSRLRSWIWPSNFPFLRWRSAFAATDEFLFRLLSVCLGNSRWFRRSFASSLSNSKRLTKSCRGIPWVVPTLIPRLQGVPNMMPTASSTYWRLASRIESGRVLSIRWVFWPRFFFDLKLEKHQGGGCKDFDMFCFWWFLAEKRGFCW